MDLPCPCGTGRAYATCCHPLHRGDVADDAAALMRSRYSAYVLGLDGYLLDSWHPDTRPAVVALEAGVRWLGLEVKRHEAEGPDRAVVAFVARYRVGGGRAVRHRETSRFRRVDGRWFYLDGEVDIG
ncbi:YchJ family protein [Lysobacter sp. SG-8]|uniref:UPF0225 protein H4F99_02030 n=1 Tax=Marilutibacter penaei TaxID=2759900 RepID=A0A7W3U1M6_9GAMM|nr:YchJ family protein [Lysobacter penaei]MBB1087262.1 YchJ family protein [Lysobacter penaei]